MTEGLMGRLSQAAVQVPSPTMRHVHSSDRQGGTDLMGVQMRNSLITDTSWVGGTMDDVTIENSRFLGSSLDLGISGSLHVADNKFELRNNPNVTKAAQFDCSAITASATRIFTFPDRSGTLALATAPTTWTPTFTQSGSVAVTVDQARYQTIGKLAQVFARVTFTAAGTAGTVIKLTNLPAAIAPVYTHASGVAVGTFAYGDVSTGTYVGAVYVVSSTEAQFRVHLGALNIGADPNFAIANTDFLSFTAMWEVA